MLVFEMSGAGTVTARVSVGGVIQMSVRHVVRCDMLALKFGHIKHCDSNGVQWRW
jgi:hypothetical protein